MIEFWTVENTGWSGGVSWFKIGGTDANPLRFNTYTPALDYATESKIELNEPATLWRVVHTTIERTVDGEVITRKYQNLESTAKEKLICRISNYLAAGGLFNPELADHEKVRDLLIECRDALK